jgi:hypothetical protein
LNFGRFYTDTHFCTKSPNMSGRIASFEAFTSFTLARLALLPPAAALVGGQTKKQRQPCEGLEDSG